MSEDLSVSFPAAAILLRYEIEKKFSCVTVPGGDERGGEVGCETRYWAHR